MAGESSKESGEGGDSRFRNTLWSRVLAAGQLDAPGARHAAEELCTIYWYPIYAFVRRKGSDHATACDLVQGFFAFLFEHNVLGKADPNRGRFRTFLLAVLRHFVHNERNKQESAKRGGKDQIVSIDELNADGRYLNEPATNLTPEKLFDRRWALRVIQQAMERLQEEYERANMKGEFAAIQPHLTGDANGCCADLARRLNRTEEATRTLLTRMRKRWRDLIRAVIADTVSDVEQVEEELRDLLAVLRES